MDLSYYTKLNYRCLILDHDDTTVDSTRTIHHPSFLDTMRRMRPELATVTLEGYFQLNCSPGIYQYYRNVARLSEEEIRQEHKNWLSFAKQHTPSPYPGIREIMRKQKELGGYLCVISHNEKGNILRDYQKNDLPVPDLIFGSELPEEEQKPFPYPIEKICRHFSLEKTDLIMLDDLIPGAKMCERAGIFLACAAWGHQTAEVLSYMKKHHHPVYRTTEEIAKLLFS